MSSNLKPHTALTSEEKDQMFKDRYSELYNHLEEGTGQGETGFVNMLMTIKLLYQSKVNEIKELKERIEALEYDSKLYLKGLKLYKLNKEGK